MEQKRYKEYSSELKKLFNERIQKISINAGFSCPNRDGTKGFGGCTYCNNQSFIPEYCQPLKTVSQQIKEGIDFFHHKYQAQKYLAYFQSYSNTYGSLTHLKKLYKQALENPQVVGLVIGTRPDCINNELLDYLESLAKTKYIMVEYGVETTENSTLELINRGHSYEEAIEAIQKTTERNIFTGVHLILGLPNENRTTILNHAKRISELPITNLKLHQLQLVKGTKMAEQYTLYPEWFKLYSIDEYIDLAIDFLERLNPDIAIERFVSQSPKNLLIAPDWGIKNYEFSEKIKKRLLEREAFQGRLYKNNPSKKPKNL